MIFRSFSDRRSLAQRHGAEDDQKERAIDRGSCAGTCGGAAWPRSRAELG